MKFRLLLLIILLTACHREELDALKKEIFELRTEIREIAQLKYEVEEIKKEVQSKNLPVKDIAATNMGTANINPANIDSANEAVIPKKIKSSSNEQDDPFLGEKTAQHVVMFFADYQCKLCANFLQTNLEKIKQDYIANKKIKFIFRDYPLSNNSQSMDAANFANCANEQGKYWEASSALIQNPELIVQAKYDKLAKTLKGIDTKKLLQCTSQLKHQKEIELDREDAKELGVTGIPSFFLGKISNAEYAGFLIRGAQPYNVIKNYLDKVLASE